MRFSDRSGVQKPEPVPLFASLELSQAVNSRGSAIEQRCALIGRVAFAEALERVPQRRIAAAQLVDREVRFEHAAIGAEALDRVLEVSARRLHQLGAGRGQGSVLPAVTVDLHVEAAKFRDHIRAACQLFDLRLPEAEHLILLARVGTAPDRTAEMVEHDRRIRERSRETDGIWDLGVCAPDLEAERAGSEMLEAREKIVTEK